MSYREHFRGYREPRTFCHIDRLHAWKHNDFFAPVTVEISPVNVCNQKCRYCYVHKKSEGIGQGGGQRLEKEFLIDIVRQCGEMGVGGLLIQGTGEPLLNKNIPDAFHEAGRQNLPVSLTTNGVLLDKPLAREILPQAFSVLFSNVVPDKERYVHMHDCPESHYDKVLGNVRRAAELRMDLNLKAALLASLYLDEGTLDMLPRYLKALKELGLDYVMVSEPLWNSDSFDGVRPSSQDTMRNKSAHIDDLLRQAHELCDDEFQFSFKLLVQGVTWNTGMSPEDWVPGRCDGVKFYTIVASDGEVYPCWRFWGNREFSYGSLHRNGLRSILQGEKAQGVYRHLNATPPESDECKVCAISTLNGNLNHLKAPTPWINFM